MVHRLHERRLQADEDEVVMPVLLRGAAHHEQEGDAPAVRLRSAHARRNLRDRAPRRNGE